ncbi:hypothetical protein GCM10011399_37670 [Subtercola lobariae]|uniref:HTH tetR-type domain-containing protein n=2 Tax=Subtercola lobariae TaxID=1588641 RepID=A0A917BHK6_9MICO|nr:hypothetical protein GCM10011399_37670 [Subtercola lobariae]
MADVAHESGVARVTVFSHFAKKEDLLFDRLPDAVALVRAAVHDRPKGTSAMVAMRTLALKLIDERHPVSGLSDGAEPFFRTVMASPTVIARARELALDVEHALAGELASDSDFSGDPDIAAALVLAVYRIALVSVVTARLAGTDILDAAKTARQRITTGFATISP